MFHCLLKLLEQSWDQGFLFTLLDLCQKHVDAKSDQQGAPNSKSWPWVYGSNSEGIKHEKKIWWILRWPLWIRSKGRESWKATWAKNRQTSQGMLSTEGASHQVRKTIIDQSIKNGSLRDHQGKDSCIISGESDGMWQVECSRCLKLLFIHEYLSSISNF